jgi:molybdate transport system substrate-binding protein
MDMHTGIRFGRLLAAVGAAALALLLAACSSSANNASASGKPSGSLVVFAAASLNRAFDKIGAQFEKANPGVTLKFNYNGSSSLATSLKQGAPADVFASANTANMKIVTDDKLASGSPEVFARNEAEIMVEAGNPKHIKSVSNLANPDIKVVVCAPEVPCGSLAKKVFKNADVTVKPVSEETSVSGVVTKISLGEADAGIVYVTDVKAGGDKIAGVSIPADDNEVADYPIVELKEAPNGSAAAAFIKYVLGPNGEKVLTSFGFLPPGS